MSPSYEVGPKPEAGIRLILVRCSPVTATASCAGRVWTRPDPCASLRSTCCIGLITQAEGTRQCKDTTKHTVLDARQVFHSTASTQHKRVL